MEYGEELSIASAMDNWLAYNRWHHTPKTQNLYSMVISRFVNSLPQQVTHVRQIKAGHLQAYVNGLLDSRRCNRTANAHLTALKSFCRWLSKKHGIPDVGRKVKMLKEAPWRQRFLSHHEYLKILEVANEKEADVIRFLANTGLRAAEIQSLTWDSVSPDGQTLTMTTFGRETRRRRVIPLNRMCREILSKYRAKPNAPIDIVTAYTRRNALYNLCKRLSRRAGIPIAGPQSYRHYFATEMLSRGVPFAQVSRLLGHSNPTITATVYAHFLPGHANSITEILSE